MAGSLVTCCRCAGQFDERALQGAWLDRRCPLCGERVSEEAYDEQARELIAASADEPGLSKAAQRNHKRNLKRKLKRTALSRYYTSEWFRLACAGQGSEAPDKGLFGLSAGYDAITGAFRLVPVDGDRSPEGGWGVSGEYFVFDAIRAEIARAGSPIATAQLVPHLVFPWLPGQKPKQWGARHKAEIDCVLMTESCAVIVEVKRRAHHVKVSGDYRHVRERTETGSFKSAPDALEQVARGAESFAERQRLYPAERIYKLVVYVEPLSFKVAADAQPFADGLLVGCVDATGDSGFVAALSALAKRLDPIADASGIRALGEEMLRDFGNTVERRKGNFVAVQDEQPARKLRRTNAMLDAIERQTRKERSALYGARLVRNLACEVQVGKRSKSGKNSRETKVKQMSIAGLLLTRSHAVLIDARRWPVHVNTHAPFATVYTGEPDEGAKHVEQDIRHDWDLESIHYRNRSGSLTLLTFAAKRIGELDGYRERNRVCTLNVFIDPATYFTNCDEFRSRTFIGYWKGSDENIIAALEQLALSAPPIMDQPALDALAARLP